MLKLFRMIRFVKAVAAAVDRCHDRLTELDTWTNTFIGKNDGYRVRAGVVTEYDAYEALEMFYDKVHKELNRYRLKRSILARFRSGPER